MVLRNIGKRYLEKLILFFWIIGFCLIYIINTPAVVISSFCLLVLTLYSGIMFFFHNSFSKKVFYLFVFFVICFIGIQIHLNKQLPIYFSMMTIISLQLCVFIKNGIISAYFPKCFLILFFLYVVVSVLFGKTTDEVFWDASRNTISSISISIAVLYYLLADDKETIEYWPTLIVIILSFLAGGRSGLTASMLLLAAVIYINCRIVLPKIIRRILLLFLVIVMWILIGPIYSFIIESTRFGALGIADVRFLLWGEYFSKLNFTNIWLGSRIDQYELIAMFSGNPHNSFINLHAMSGIVGVFVILFIAMSLLKLVSHNVFYIIIIPMLFRVCFDIFFFFGIFDFIIYYVIFLGLGATSWRQNAVNCHCYM